MARRRKKTQFPLWNIAMLGGESQRVMYLRMTKLALGGADAEKEARLMVSEKMAAFALSGWQLMLGASPDAIVSNYRTKVRANAKRLSGPRR